MNKYRLILCRDRSSGMNLYTLFCGRDDPTFIDNIGEWEAYDDGCLEVRKWDAKRFHKMSTIRLKPGEGPRDVTLEFA